MRLQADERDSREADTGVRAGEITREGGVGNDVLQLQIVNPHGNPRLN